MSSGRKKKLTTKWLAGREKKTNYTRKMFSNRVCAHLHVSSEKKKLTTKWLAGQQQKKN